MPYRREGPKGGGSIGRTTTIVLYVSVVVIVALYVAFAIWRLH